MRRLATLLALLVALAAPELARAQSPHVDDPLTLGNTLYYEGDYYRAITEFKRHLARTSDPDERDAVLLKIAWMYNASGEHAAAGAVLRRIIDGRAPDDRLAVWATLYFGDMALAAGQSSAAAEIYARALARCKDAGIVGGRPGKVGRGDCRFIESYARLGRARVHARLHDFEAAADELDLVPGTFPKAARVSEIAAHVRGVQMPNKNPALAGALSIVPGLGHFYIEEYGAGVVAMVWNGAFIYAFVDSLLAQKYGQATVIGLVELIWYSGTIFGAVAGANRFNRDARRIVEDGLNSDLDGLGPTSPWPVQFPMPDAPVLNFELTFEW